MSVDTRGARTRELARLHLDRHTRVEELVAACRWGAEDARAEEVVVDGLFAGERVDAVEAMVAHGEDATGGALGRDDFA